MSNLFWLTETQMVRLRPFFPKSHGIPRVDDKRVLSGIIFINRNGLRWCDAPSEYGPSKTLYNRWKRWSDMGVFARIMTGLAAEAPDHKTISIERGHEHQAACRYRHKRSTDPVLHDRRSGQRLHWGQGAGEQPAIGRLAAGRSGIRC